MFAPKTKLPVPDLLKYKLLSKIQSSLIGFTAQIILHWIKSINKIIAYLIRNYLIYGFDQLLTANQLLAGAAAGTCDEGF
jgi:hypothetical protein